MTYVVRKTTHHGQFREVVTAEGETKAEAYKNALAAGNIGYAITWDETNEYHVRALENFLIMGVERSLGWADYQLLEPVTPRNVAHAIEVGRVAGRPRTYTLAENTPDVSVFVEDPTGPNGMREFIVSVREVGDEQPETLPNGATVIKRKSGVVLAVWRDEFVTWAEKDGQTFWGHYHGEDLVGALADFNNRVGAR